MYPSPNTYDFLVGLGEICLLVVGAAILSLVVVAIVDERRKKAPPRLKRVMATEWFGCMAHLEDKTYGTYLESGYSNGIPIVTFLPDGGSEPVTALAEKCVVGFDLPGDPVREQPAG